MGYQQWHTNKCQSHMTNTVTVHSIAYKKRCDEFSDGIVRTLAGKKISEVQDCCEWHTAIKLCFYYKTATNDPQGA